MQNETEYCNLLVSKLLPIANKINNNWLIFN